MAISYKDIQQYEKEMYYIGIFIFSVEYFCRGAFYMRPCKIHSFNMNFSEKSATNKKRSALTKRL